jgi:hypothetical protein
MDFSRLNIVFMVFHGVSLMLQFYSYFTILEGIQLVCVCSFIKIIKYK